MGRVPCNFRLRVILVNAGHRSGPHPSPGFDSCQRSGHLGMVDSTASEKTIAVLIEALWQRHKEPAWVCSTMGMRLVRAEGISCAMSHRSETTNNAAAAVVH